MKIGLLEILILESIALAALWLFDDYVALILTITITCILIAVLLISLASERLERSRVPKRFFYSLFWAIFPPIIIGITYTFLINGQFAWLNDI